jgi:large conductance mechanosensitive channel
MLSEFRTFLIKQNAIALAIAVVIGAALNGVVTAVVDNLIMPVVAAATPGGAWRTATLDLGPMKFGIGLVAAALLNFFIVGLVAWRISKAFIRPSADPEKPTTKACPYCRMADLDVNAVRCPHCTSQLAEVPSLPTLGATAPVARR